LGEFVENFTPYSRFGFLIVECSIFQVASKRLLHSIHGRFGKAATMITDLHFSLFSNKATDAANGLVSGKGLGIHIAMLLDFGIALWRDHQSDCITLTPMRQIAQASTSTRWLRIGFLVTWCVWHQNCGAVKHVDVTAFPQPLCLRLIF